MLTTLTTTELSLSGAGTRNEVVGVGDGGGKVGVGVGLGVGVGVALPPPQPASRAVITRIATSTILFFFIETTFSLLTHHPILIVDKLRASGLAESYSIIFVKSQATSRLAAQPAPSETDYRARLEE